MPHNLPLESKEFWRKFPGRNLPHKDKRSAEELREKNHRVYLKRKESGKQRAYNEALKAKVLTHYGNGVLACVRCGFDDLRALSLDHIDRDGMQDKRKAHWKYLTLRRDNYPEGYQTLCMNCQFIKRDENREYRA